MKIGILGGSFNPPHKRHLEMALELVNKHYVDKIIYVPTGAKYEYKNNLIANEDRYEMLKLMTSECKEIEVSKYEFKDHVVYTCETLAYYQEQYPDDEIYFICGTDNLSYIDKWKNGLDILRKYKLLVIERETNRLDELLVKFNEYREKIVVVPMELSSVSSTYVRDLIRNGKYEMVGEIVDDRVLDYIVKRKLYEEK